MYQAVYGDLEDFANECKVSKAKKGWFRINDEPVDIQAEVPEKLEDGTTEMRKAKGLRIVSKITLTAFGYLNPTEAELKAMTTSTNPPKPDTQLVFNTVIAAKECFSQEDVQAFEKEKDGAWKQVLTEVKKTWDGAFFEGVGSIIG